MSSATPERKPVDIARPIEIAREEELPGSIQNENASIDDVPQLGLVAAIASLSYVFWVVGGMEMIERLAYYGVKAVATLYAKDPISKGGLGVTMGDFGIILMTWAMVQSIVPAFTGGLSDRFGYKQTIAVSTVVKIIGYLIMFATATLSGGSFGGYSNNFWGFFLGAIVLATGTAIFKPGIQGTLVKATRRDNSSMAWGIFYQTVNIGGWLGPLVAGYMRKMEWRYVFLACAGIISINFLMLLIYKEPGKLEREAALVEKKNSGEVQVSLFRDSMSELSRPHVWPYLLIFSGFWFMFNSLFDVLPAHLEEWVDSRDIVGTLFGTSQPHGIAAFLIVVDKSGLEVSPEGLLNVNAGLIMTTCFLFAWASGRMKAINSMMLGTLFASVSLCVSGYASLGWISLFAISVFSIGEMLSSPKFSEYIGNFAPANKKAMYLGFSQIPLAIGWTLEGRVGPKLYDHFASKDTFAREALAAKGMTADAIAAIPQGEAFDKFKDFMHLDKFAATEILRQGHHPEYVWYIMAVVGVISAYGIWWYGRWVKTIVTK